MRLASLKSNSEFVDRNGPICHYKRSLIFFFFYSLLGRCNATCNVSGWLIFIRNKQGLRMHLTLTFVTLFFFPTFSNGIENKFVECYLPTGFSCCYRYPLGGAVVQLDDLTFAV